MEGMNRDERYVPATPGMTGQRGESCFVSMLRHFLDLTDHEQEALAGFEKSEKLLQADELAYRQGEPATELYVVKSGWVCSHRYTETGQRHILQIRHPGDLCGMHDQMLCVRSHSLMALEDSVVCPFPISNLPRLMRTAPRVFLLINALSALDQVLLFDLIHVIARTSARERVLHLLLHLLHRLKITNASMTTTFRLPVTQALIGDLLGLTNVSVSKSMTQLEKEKLIIRGRGVITIPDLEHAMKRVEFKDRYSAIELGWLQ